MKCVILLIIFAIPICSSAIEVAGRSIGWVYAVHVQNDRAAVCAGSVLIILDVEKPSDPKELGRMYIPGLHKGVFISGNYVYVASGEDGFHIIDISEPKDPKKIGFYDTPGQATALYIYRDHAFIADGSGGLRILNISNKRKPRELGFCEFPGLAWGVCVSGDLAYIASYDSGLSIINISNKQDPNEIGFYSLKEASDIYVSGNNAYIANGNKGIYIIDISDPRNPKDVGSYDTPGNAIGIEVFGNHAYVADSNGTKSGWRTTQDFKSRLSVLDVSNPTKIREVAEYITPGYIREISILGNCAYIADRKGGLRVIDISEPSKPSEVAVRETIRWAMGVCMSGNYAYVADFYKGVWVLDISDPNLPKEVGLYKTPAEVLKIHVSNNRLYVLTLDCNTWIIDLSDPVNLKGIGCFYVGTIAGAFVSGDYALFVSEGILKIMDVSNPHNPSEKASFKFETSFYGDGVYLYNEYAYVVDYEEGLFIVNISDLSNPKLVGVYDEIKGAEYIFISRKYAYITSIYDSICNLWIMDISKPGKISKVGVYQNEPYFSNGVYVYGNYAYIGYDDSGVEIIDISDPSNPKKVETYSGYKYGSESGVPVVSGGYIYFADGYNGLCVLRFDEWSVDFDNKQVITWGKIKQDMLLQNYPNPFNPETWIPFQISERSAVRIKICNSVGQIVKTFDLGVIDAGSYISKERAVHWDGNNDLGEKLASGLYFYTIITGNYTATRKMTLLD